MTAPFAAPHTDGAASAAFIEKRPLEQYVAPDKPSLVGLPRDALAAALGTIGVPERQQRMRVQQIWHWLYVRGAQDFDAMTTLSKELRAELAQHFTAARPEVAAEQVSVDGTRKWLLRLPGETDSRPRGRMRLHSRNRSRHAVHFQPGRLHAQLHVLPYRHAAPGAQSHAGRDRRPGRAGARPPRRLERAASPSGEGEKRLVSNVVMMGMGEPLYNFEAVRDGLNVVADGEGLSISKRRITLSTSGVVPNIARAGEEIGSMLAVSLHAVTDELRDELVPLNRKYPLRELLDACRNYPGVSNARRITFEYVMLKGINDSLADARALVRLVKGIPAKINLIPFNPWPGTQYECSDWEQIEKFSEVIFNAGYASPVRTPRGRDILAACGQLKSATEKLSARERLALRAMAMTD